MWPAGTDIRHRCCGAGLGGWLRDVRAVLATPSVLLSVFGAAASNFAIGAITVWVPTFVNAVEGGQAAVEAAGGISPTLVFGGVTVVSGLSGTVLGSVISDKLSATLTDWGAESLVCAIAMLGSAPLIGTALFLATGFDSLLPFWAFVLVVSPPPFPFITCTRCKSRAAACRVR